MILYANVILSIPIRSNFTFSYEADDFDHASALLIGSRVLVPFGKQNKNRVAIVVSVHKTNPNTHTNKIKRISEVLDFNFLNLETLRLLNISQQYYFASGGDIFTTALPKKVRDGEKMSYPTETIASYVSSANVNSRAKKQQMCLEQLKRQGGSETLRSLKSTFGTALVKTLVDRGCISLSERNIENFGQTLRVNKADQHAPNSEQQIAIDAIGNSVGYEAYLLDGVTGSGKTEVYFHVVERILNEGKQVHVVVPEIALTPQLLSRFENRFQGVRIGIYHSKINDSERAKHYNDFRLGVSAILIGTRSSVFIPAKKLGLIVVDEEHDTSVKTTEKRFAYHGRDVAVLKAKIYSVPIVLGSATPSLESIHNCDVGKYKRLYLNERATNHSLAPIGLINIKGQRLQAGLSNEAIKAIDDEVKLGNQVIVYLNKRGFNPISQCTDCGYVPSCKACDKPYHYHISDNRHHCHVCGSTRKLVKQCPICHGSIASLGIGTQQVENELRALFPELASNDKSILRIDSDSTSRKKALNDMLDAIDSQQTKIIVGTQILSKGHHFHKVSLVLVVDIDGEVLAKDEVRSLETLSANIIQVSGRSGRNGHGRVLIQTRDVDNDYFKLLATQDYRHIATELMQMRESKSLPPFVACASVTATSFRKEKADAFLVQSAGYIRQCGNVNVSEPKPSSIKKKCGQYSETIDIYASNRAELNAAMRSAIDELERQAKTLCDIGLAWDIDPINIRIR